MPSRAEKEARRFRSKRKFYGSTDPNEAKTGHAPLMAVTPSFELGAMPEGGGYPVGYIEHVARLMGCDDLAAILHLCSGSVVAPFTIDARHEGSATPTIVGDVRWLPIRPNSQRWIMCDPPYGDDYAQELWGLGAIYPAPIVVLRECLTALRPGGLVAFLHHVVPRIPDGMDRVATYGITTGPGYRIRALTIARKHDGGLW